MSDIHIPEELISLNFHILNNNTKLFNDEICNLNTKYFDSIIDNDGNTLLLQACRQGNINIIKILLKYNININLRNREDWNALHYSIFHKNNEICELLLENRINLFALNCDGLSPFHIACIQGYPEGIRLLLKYGADIHEPSKSGWSPLHLATSKNLVPCIQILLENNGDPNIIKYPQGTPLHIAAKNGFWQSCIALLNGGALHNIKNSKGNIPLDLTKEQRIRNILINASKTEYYKKEEEEEYSICEIDLEEETELLNLESQLFNDIDEYVLTTTNNRKSLLHSLSSSSIIQDKRLSEQEKDEKRFSINVRRSSVLKPLVPTINIVPPLNAWRNSGLHVFNNNNLDSSSNDLLEDVEYIRRGSRKADSILLTFGQYPNMSFSHDDDIYAYPGASKVIQSSNMLWAWLARVAGVVIDKQAKESMEHILRLLNTLFNQDKGKKKSIKSFVSLAAIILYQNNSHIRSEKIITNNNIIDKTIHYFKFSCGAYGWKMLNPLMFSDKRKGVLLQGFLTGDSINNKALCDHTGINEDDIIITKWTSSDYHPAHYIALDHSTTSIIIAIRGSFHVKDALVDLIAAASPFKGGYAHTGMLECAKRKLTKIRIPLLQTIAKYPSYNCVVIGHSLGAGTASLLTLLLKDELPTSIHLQCYAFAPPCVVSSNLAKQHENLINSFILGNDCVPRLSFASVSKLNKLSTLIMEQGSSSVDILLKVKRKQIHIDNLSNSLHFDINEALLPPGKCYHIIQEDSNIDWIPDNIIRKCYRMEESCPTLFSEIVICSSMFSDHVPWSYQTAFEGVQVRQTFYNKNENSKPINHEINN